VLPWTPEYIFDERNL